MWCSRPVASMPITQPAGNCLSHATMPAQLLRMLRQGRCERAHANTISRPLISAPITSLSLCELDMRKLSRPTADCEARPAHASKAVVKSPARQYTEQCRGGCLRGVSLFLSVVRCPKHLPLLPKSTLRKTEWGHGYVGLSVYGR